MATIADQEHLLSKNTVKMSQSKSLRDLFHATNECIYKKQHNSILKKCKEKFLSLETVIHDNSVCLWDNESKSVNYLTQNTPKDVVLKINEENTFNFNPPKVTTKSSLSITCHKTDTISTPPERFVKSLFTLFTLELHIIKIRFKRPTIICAMAIPNSP